jgi:neutral ceramidase
MEVSDTLKAGAATVEITPEDSQFLCGYPHVERYSTGVHDPLMSSALYLNEGDMEVLFIANDIVLVSKDIIKSARKRIAQAVGIEARHIMITATHTHSGPLTSEMTAWKADRVIPSPDEKYLQILEDGIVCSGIEAYKNARPAQVGLALADGTGVGTNRHDPSEPADPQVPVLIVKSAEDKTNIACMLVFSMHPTVLHEDSKLVSADFPGMTRQYLAENVLGKDCPIVYHMGAAGNQSPRHITRANTFEEAQRLGYILGRAVEKVIPQISYTRNISLSCMQKFIDFKMRSLPDIAAAQEQLDVANEKYRQLQKNNAPSQEIRTAECDVFGAEGILNLAKIAVDGELDAQFIASMPYEIQIIRIGPWNFVGWQGELFVEYSLAVKSKVDNVFLISMANGPTPSYIVTQKAFDKGGYEATGTLFSPETGQIIVDRTLQMLGQS